ncbi:kinase-like domain-containing protein [Sphaerosporella brunnea]|uniref:Serine/threonine-protein kinase CBK1 n=1 Tax=Sphaerosporella brunnea TaxID=1250544 RepID=A0A5J5F1B8_9PEZI|nr:kinase-like domain-containing protein [Sphaerosporella brunnea]
MNSNGGRDPNFTPTPSSMYQQFYGQQPPQQQGYPQQQQQFPPQGFANQPQAQQYQQFQQQQNFQQQQQYAGGYDANGLAHQLQNQHLSRPRTSGSTQASGSLNNDYIIFSRDDSMFSSSTKERAKALKLKVELHYNQSVAHAVERNQRRVELEQELASEARMSEERKNRRRQQLGKQESSFLRLRRLRLTADDFLTVKVIGKGAFGEVRLVQKKDTGKIYAMKTLLKSEMFKKDQLAHVKAERDVLADSDSPWVVNLFYSFQDAVYLYLIMEFLPGGDLMTMLIKYEIFTEDVTRFYMAQCVLAIETVHKLGFIHRDIKPDNILIDKDGHIKLSDFGLSTGFHKTHDQAYYQRLLENTSTPPSEQQTSRPRNSVMVDAIHLTVSNRNQINTWRKSRRLMAYSTVGTPDYIAPEIFLHSGYGQECDWWSLGTIMFECLVGWPPFCAEDAQETYRKIVNWQTQLYFPDEIQLSPEAEDLIRSLITSADQRLGRHGAEEIKAHPFFRGVNWDSLRSIDAPFKPQLTSITDTSYFPTDELENVPERPEVAAARANAMSQQPTQIGEETGLPFIGYTYTRFNRLSRQGGL